VYLLVRPWHCAHMSTTSAPDLPELDELLQLAEVRRLAESGEASQIRANANVPAHGIARAIGTSHVTVLRWERGERTPTGPAALRYLAVLRALRKSRQ
jgi:DNA-binding transcriptional regulator YiaG